MSKFAQMHRLWPHIPACIAIAREGSLLAAAKVLEVDRTTVSRALSAAETVLGARLFDREKGRLTLTDIGRAFIAHAEAAELQLRDAAAAAFGEPALSMPRVRIAIPTNLASQIAPLIFDLLHTHADLKLTVRGGYGVEDIAGRDADIAVRVLRQPPSDDLYAEPVCEVRGRIYQARTPRLGEAMPIARSEADTSLSGDQGSRLVVQGIVEHAAFLACSGQGRMPDYLASDSTRFEAISELLPPEGWKIWLVMPRALRRLAPYNLVFEALRRLRLA